MTEYETIIRENEDEINHYKELEQRMYEEREKPKEKIITELTGYMEMVKDFDKDSAQDASALHAYLITLTNYMARSNFIMAEYNRKFREEKKRAYHTLAASSEAQKKYYSATLAKDFIDAQCSEVGFVFDLAERCSRLCNHTEKAIITIISSLKSERVFSNYAT